MKKIKLEDINKRLPFEVPNKYFDELPSIVQNRVTTTPTPIFTVSWSWKRSVLVATSSVLIGVLIWATYPSKQHSIGTEALSQVHDEAIIDYLNQDNIVASDLPTENNANLNNTLDSTIINQLEISEQDIIKHLDSELTEI
jgi:hypothetical protein